VAHQAALVHPQALVLLELLEHQAALEQVEHQAALEQQEHLVLLVQ